MAITLTGTGGLFTRLGKLGGILNYINLVRGSTSTPYVPFKVNALQAQFASADQNLIDLIYTNLNGYQQASGGYLSSINSLATQTLIQMVNEVYPLPSLTVAQALPPLIAQMVATPASVQQSVPAISVSVGGSNVGNPSVVIEALPLDQNGLVLELVFPETMALTVTGDSSNGSQAGQEPYKVIGQAVNQNPLDFAFPGGSGASFFSQIVDPTTSNGNNLLSNSDFETFTVTNIPDGWAVTVTGSTTVTKDTSHQYSGSNCVAITSDGTGLATLLQAFGSNTGATQSLSPRTKYAFTAQVKCSAAAPAAGVLAFSLVDGSGNVINNVQSVANTITIGHAALTTSYQTVSGFFETPATLLNPPYGLRIKTTTALTNTDVYYIDHLGMSVAQQLYTGGPFLALFAGSTNVVKGDTFSLVVTNTFGGFQQLFDKFYGTRNLGLLLPSSLSSPSGVNPIADSLIA